MTGYKTEWVEEDRQRVMTMDQLYIEDGRHHKDHPKHGLYTGLHQEILVYEKWKKIKEG
tara:strand:+ start:598 stop:774 length:177 start_codon:yes stop_codon:yes gene_type:complete